MRLLLTFSLFLISLCGLSFAQETPLEDDGTRVTVLGYHNFSEKKAVTDMLIKTSKFRQQMQTIKDLKLNVISLEDFKLWKSGKISIPDRSVLITIDDGWKSVYTDAYPVLKEFGFPFTVYLYTEYIDVGGDSMTTTMIQEMMKNGCSIGSHSVSHPFPREYKKQQKAGEEQYTAFLETEFGESKQALQKKFEIGIDTYVYPGGYYDETMFPVIDKHNYDYLFTCKPGKTTRSTANREIPRYIILGESKNDYIFKLATAFKPNASAAIFAETPHPVTPDSGETIVSRIPLITADLSAIENLNPTTVEMRIPGLGKVPAEFNPETKLISWQMNRSLRSTSCSVQVQWKLQGKKKFEPALTWTFLIDREAGYATKSF